MRIPIICDLFLVCYPNRKMNLRDMKVFQRQEQKQGIELMSKIRRQWEAQEQRFEQEIQVLTSGVNPKIV